MFWIPTRINANEQQFSLPIVIEMLLKYTRGYTREGDLPELLSSREYKRAPITEAVIDFRMNSDFSPRVVETIVRRLGKLYPDSKEMQNIDVKLDATSTGGVLSVNQSPQGFRLSNREQNEVVIVQPGGVTASRLAPYMGWEELREAAQTVYSNMRKSSQQPVARIGVRYINRIDVPINSSTSGLLSHYLNFYPNVPTIYGGPMLKYVAQVIQPSIIPHWIYSITSTTTAAPLPKHFSLLLDIDVFRTEDIPRKDVDLWSVLEEAQRIKNDIFERCITDNTRELIS
ncbi:MAG: TIGR04255 family protein [Rhizobiaceae bacterium]